jgi:Na+/glutamate symporter
MTETQKNTDIPKWVHIFLFSCTIVGVIIATWLIKTHPPKTAGEENAAHKTKTEQVEIENAVRK